MEKFGVQCRAMITADKLRTDDNGIGGVCLQLGRGGKNVCVLWDASGVEIGKGQSDRDSEQAILSAVSNWLARRRNGRDPHLPI